MKKLKKLKKLKLTESEKKELFARIRRSIARSPDGAETDFKYPVQSPFYRFAFFPHTAWMKAGVLALLVLSLSGATAYASLGALPGDLLYGVKVNVVEKVSKITARSPESRAEVETVHIERRIAEFETLAERDQLTEKRTRVIEKNITERLKNFDRNVSDIKEKTGRPSDETPEEEELDLRLEKHIDNIVKIRAEKAEDKQALEAVIERVEFRREKRREREEAKEEKRSREDREEDAGSDGDKGEDGGEREDEDEDRNFELEIPKL